MKARSATKKWVVQNCRDKDFVVRNEDSFAVIYFYDCEATKIFVSKEKNIVGYDDSFFFYIFD